MRIGLSEREYTQIFFALVAYRNIFRGLSMPTVDLLIEKFRALVSQQNINNNERKGDSDQ